MKIFYLFLALSYYSCNVLILQNRQAITGERTDVGFSDVMKEDTTLVLTDTMLTDSVLETDVGPVYYYCIGGADYDLLDEFSKKRKRKNYVSPYGIVLQYGFLEDNGPIKISQNGPYGENMIQSEDVYSLIPLDATFMEVSVYYGGREYTIPINPFYRNIVINDFIEFEEDEIFHFQNTLVYYYMNPSDFKTR